MRYDERDDSELLELAQAGWAPAFAVLVHRHAPGLLAAFADDPDPVDRVTDVFVRAMRQLPERDATAPVGAWLAALAGRPVAADAPPVDAAVLDPIWQHLAVLWPDGRHVHHTNRPLRRVALTVLGAIALGIAVPTIVLGLPSSADEPVESVRAEPLEEEPTDEDETDEPELPAFEFPDVGTATEQEPVEGPVEPVAPPPTTDGSAPTAPTAPSQPVTPAQPTEPASPVEPDPLPTAEPTSEPTTEPPPPTDGGGTDDGSGDGGDGGGSDDGPLPIGDGAAP